MNRVDRSDPNIRLYPYSPYGCAGHSAPSLERGVLTNKIRHQNTNYE